MIINRLIKGLFLLCMLASLASCGDQMKALSKMGKVAMDPDIPVGDNSEQPSIVRLHIRATDDANPNAAGKASPVRLQIYQLKSPHIFMNSDYYSLQADPIKVLKTTYIKHEEYEVNPDSWLPMEELELKPSTEAIAVLAFFNDIDTTQWRAAIPVESKGKTYDYLVLATDKEVRILDNDPSKYKDSKNIKEAERQQKLESDHHYVAPPTLDDTEIVPVPKPEPSSEKKRPAEHSDGELSNRDRTTFNQYHKGDIYG